MVSESGWECGAYNDWESGPDMPLFALLKGVNPQYPLPFFAVLPVAGLLLFSFAKELLQREGLPACLCTVCSITILKPDLGKVKYKTLQRMLSPSHQ